MRTADNLQCVTSDGALLGGEERAVLSLATEDAFALWEVADEIGGDPRRAARVVSKLLALGLIQLGVEDWSEDPPKSVVDGKYVDVPFVGDVGVMLADAESWRADSPRKVVVSATAAGITCHHADA
jgi:predicted transcriptional regulator